MKVWMVIKVFYLVVVEDGSSFGEVGVGVGGGGATFRRFAVKLGWGVWSLSSFFLEIWSSIEPTFLLDKATLISELDAGIATANDFGACFSFWVVSDSSLGASCGTCINFIVFFTAGRLGIDGVLSSAAAPVWGLITFLEAFEGSWWIGEEVGEWLFSFLNVARGESSSSVVIF